MGVDIGYTWGLVMEVWVGEEGRRGKGRGRGNKR